MEAIAFISLGTRSLKIAVTRYYSTSTSYLKIGKGGGGVLWQSLYVGSYQHKREVF